MTPVQTPPDGGAVAFAERLIALLDQGSFTATYKYAVLLGLLDLCMEKVSAKGTLPDSLTTRALAEKVIELYWPHTVPYPGVNKSTVLRQNTGRGRQAEILTTIRTFRESLGEDPLAPLARARAAAPAAFERLLRSVEWKLIEMPLPRLQRVGATEHPFVYEVAWDLDVRAAEVRRYQQGQPGAFDNRIILRPGVAEWLVQLNGVVRPLLHRHWAAMVAQINRLEESRLERFLFDTKRVDLGAVRKGLRELQDGACFYCRRPVRQAGEVDHFLPWSRYPDDGLDNLVFADRACNGAKRDFLASARHVVSWRARMNDVRLTRASVTLAWDRRTEATLGVARAIYLRLPEAVPLWDAGNQFEPAARSALEPALA